MFRTVINKAQILMAVIPRLQLIRGNRKCKPKGSGSGLDRWRGKTAVVTGASTGIGKAITLSLANAGLKVVAMVWKQADVAIADKLKCKVKGQGSICSIPCDVTKSEEIATAFCWVEEHFRGVDVLVNNAGTLHDGQITAVGDRMLSEELIAATLDTNIKGLVFCTRHAVASMKKRKFDGHIFHISSVTAHYVPTTVTFNVYPATKHAVTCFGGSLNNELAQFKSKIRVTCISPGLTTTVLAEGLIKELGLPVLHPRDLANGVVWALSTPPHVNVTELTINAVEQISL